MEGRIKVIPAPRSQIRSQESRAGKGKGLYRSISRRVSQQPNGKVLQP